MQTHSKLRSLLIAALCLALCYVLPNFTGNIPQIGSMLLPMHLPVLLCGFLCGPLWGAAVGFVAPLSRSLQYGMPVFFPNAVSMAFELLTYGLVAGLLYKKLPRTTRGIYMSLIGAMVSGRIVWGLVQLVLTISSPSPLTAAGFIASALTGSIPGILIQLILIPIIVLRIQRSIKE